MKKRLSADYIAKIAILSALSFVLFTFARFPIFPPPYNVMDLDFSSLPVLLGGFSLGPVAVVIMELIKVGAKIATEGVGFHNGIGDLSNFIVSLAFALPAAIIYKYNHTKKGAYIGLAVASVSQVVIAAISNYFLIIPLFAKVPGMGAFMEIRAEFSFIYGSLFNLIKGVSNALLAVIFYKRLSPFLKRSYINKKSCPTPRVTPQNYPPDDSLNAISDETLQDSKEQVSNKDIDEDIKENEEQ